VFFDSGKYFLRPQGGVDWCHQEHCRAAPGSGGVRHGQRRNDGWWTRV
jgi:hypothetical protein